MVCIPYYPDSFFSLIRQHTVFLYIYKQHNIFIITRMELHYTPQSELNARIKKLQDELAANDIDAALIIQKADLFYFSGTCQNAHLIVPASGAPVLWVKKNIKRAQRESALDIITTLSSLKDISAQCLALNRKGKIGMELDVIPANLFFKYQKVLEPMEVLDISKIIRKIRSVKSGYEIEHIKKAADLNFAMYSSVAGILKTGATEIEMAAELEAVMRRKGHQGGIRMRTFNQELFYGHLMSGWNAAYPSFFDGATGGMGLNPSYPQGAGFKKIERNEPVLIDYAGVHNGYIIDQTRIFVIGELSDKLVAAHNVALDIKRRIAGIAVPGSNGKDLYETAYHMVTEAGLKNHFMGYGDQLSFIGHGVGIELDELPILAKNFDFILEPGMVFALEPKFVFPDEGVVGVEDTFVVTETGAKQLTCFDDAIQKL